jgi:hypothetical protein
LIFAIPFDDAYAVSHTLSDNLSCTYATQNGGLGGTWDSSSNTCTINYLTLNSADTLTVVSGVTLVIDQAISNSGSIHNSGIITINNGAIFYNTVGSLVNNEGATINNNGTINNSSTINNKAGGTINNNAVIGGTGGYIINSGTINNGNSGNLNGKIDDNGGSINNSNTVGGTIHQFCGGSISGKPVSFKNLQCATVTVSSSKSPSLFGNQIMFTVTVLPPSATGNFTLYDGTNELYFGSLILGGTGTFSTSVLTVGTHSVSATYSGDANDGFSTSPTLTQTVNKGNTTITITSSNQKTTFGQSVTFTAVVLPNTATGSVQFNENTNPPTILGTESISGGQATFVTSSLSGGMHSISATYSGDTNYADSTSTIMTQAVISSSNTNASTQQSPPVSTPPVTPNMPSVSQTTIQIPQWIHNNAKWWSEGTVSDNDFVQGIQYLIQQKIIVIPPTTQTVSSNQIPVWIKNVAGYWANGQISDSEFVRGIQFLIQVGIIKV